MERNQDGLYIITIPSTNGNEMTSSGSYSVLIASGEAGSDDGLMTGSEGGHDEVYLVRVSQNGDHTYFPLVSCFSLIITKPSVKITLNTKYIWLSLFNIKHTS